ncbi:MAG: aminoacyl-tRNA hydrolase [bacterium]|nr:aminoacyl-tRNA hydrolase [bacterium]
MAASPITLIAALGNYGHEYERTRHNIAWQMLENVSFYNELSWQSKFKGEYASHTIDDRKVFFLKPMTYMNLSGESILPLMQFFKIPMEEILVLHDELELDYGVMGFKQGGGLAGHNGLRSTVKVLGTRDFKRMRLGISRPTHGDITPYVLGNFSADQQIVLPTFLEAAAELLEVCLESNFDNMVKKYRKKNAIPPIPGD